MHRSPPAMQEFPGKNTGVVAFFFSRGSYQSRGHSHISCIYILYLYINIYFLRNNYSCQPAVSSLGRGWAPHNGENNYRHSPPSGTGQAAGQKRTPEFPSIAPSLRFFLKSFSRTCRKELTLPENLDQHLFEVMQDKYLRLMEMPHLSIRTRAQFTVMEELDRFQELSLTVCELYIKLMWVRRGWALFSKQVKLVGS